MKTIRFVMYFFVLGVVLMALIIQFALRPRPHGVKYYTGTAAGPSLPINSTIIMHGNERLIDPKNGSCLQWVVDGILSDSGTACPGGPTKLPTLKQLVCKLDAEACKRHLQYRIDDFHNSERTELSWSAWAWVQGKDFEDLAGYADQGGFSGWFSQDADGSVDFKTKEAAIGALLYALRGAENIHPKLRPRPTDVVHMEPAIVGPLNCDPHRQCQ